ncbi:uncharacterized protein LOC126919038 isoform X3 [Bombus affinis]|uniref:uncharacterized protein LOC126919038 isoform X3 n=1 Tax=Bombus affinis TaxID=309941 RepID=UPI0021B785B0|nr:uncharacterized protein LOC126919038 isoform X3 [Bombus affinis]
MNMHLSVRYQADQPRNPKYEEDIIYVTKHNKWVLNSIGMWPAVLEGIGKFVPKIVIGLSNFVSFFSVVQCVLHIILEEKDPLLRLRLLGLACYSSTNLMKYWALILRKPNIEYCIEQIQTDWKQVEFPRNRLLMLKYGKIGRDLTIYSAAFMYTGLVCYVTIMQYAMGLNMKANNRTIRVLVYPTYSGFFDAQKSPIYEIVFSAMIESVLQEVCFFEFVGSTFVICLLEYYCITDWQQNNKIGLATYSMLLVSLTFNMFLLCYIGNLLLEKSTNIGISCYMIDWYRLPVKTVQDLMLIIAMSNSPVKISGGRMFLLSLPTFGNVGFYKYFLYVLPVQNLRKSIVLSIGN